MEYSRSSNCLSSLECRLVCVCSACAPAFPSIFREGSLNQLLSPRIQILPLLSANLFVLTVLESITLWYLFKQTTWKC